MNKVSNVPEEIRNVPFSALAPITTPIADDEVTVGPRTGMFVRYGGKFPLIEDNLYKDILSFRTGIELELGGMYSGDNPTNQITAAGPFDANYYSIYTKAGPDWNSFLIPKLFAGIEFRVSDSLSLGAGYSIWREDLVAETGRYIGKSESTGNGTYTQSQTRNGGFNLVDMAVGSVFGSLKYKTGKGYNGYNLFIELGMQNILDKKYYDLGREADIDFGKNPFTVSVGGSLSF
ncbi:MAG: hypothetical protein AABX96_03235 [Nanoarchaeota archaeon]